MSNILANISFFNLGLPIFNIFFIEYHFLLIFDNISDHELMPDISTNKFEQE